MPRTSGRRDQHPHTSDPIPIPAPIPAPLPASNASVGDNGDDDQLMTTDQSAAFLSTTSGWLEDRRALDRKKGKPGLHGPRWMKLGPRLVRYKRRWLKEYQDANSVDPDR